jgi:hypothetical protein
MTRIAVADIAMDLFKPISPGTMNTHASVQERHYRVQSPTMKAGAVADILGGLYHSRHPHASALLIGALAKLAANR